ncbi:terminase small subunit-like protein [Aquirhabdus parva]|uniref:Terminase small subunit protein n=1 Tax=Aquirhabdus parva TaxID=2283318 RepID=A0A345P9B0_9GAMM|nr:terminase small subunit protein [Aquirhabdus parva]AXI03869.1 terminase small subunit protein [Aquirhabdus parva]
MSTTVKAPYLVEQVTALGRPSDYSLEICEAICARLIEGESLRTICRRDDMPAISTVMNWLRQHQAFAELYARARELQADAMFEQLLDIADDGTNDYGVNEDGESNGKLDRDHITRSRLRIDTRKWILARMNPKKYGDAVSMRHSGDAQNPVGLLVTQLQGSSIPVVAEAMSDDD